MLLPTTTLITGFSRPREKVSPQACFSLTITQLSAPGPRPPVKPRTAPLIRYPKLTKRRPVTKPKPPPPVQVILFVIYLFYIFTIIICIIFVLRRIDQYGWFHLSTADRDTMNSDGIIRQNSENSIWN
jgi:hypothetical protein